MRIDKLPVITLWQPWAQWIMLGWKTIETRTHSRFASLENKIIYIHAGGKWDKSALNLARPYLTKEQIEQTIDIIPMKSAIICSAHISKFDLLNNTHSKDALIECNTERWGLFLNDIKQIEPIYCKGSQGIWYYNGL